VGRPALGPSDSEASGFARALELGAELLCRALLREMDGVARPQAQNLALGREYRSVERGLLAEWRSHRRLRKGLLAGGRTVGGRILTQALYLLGVLAWSLGLSGMIRRLGAANPKVLLYHDISPSESDYVAGLDCTTAPDVFRLHLTYVKAHYAVVDLLTLASGQAPPGAVAITFDDGYASLHSHAFPILQELGLPATVFLVADVVGNRDLVWVNELAFALRRAPDKAMACVRRHFTVPKGANAVQTVSALRLSYDPRAMTALLTELREELRLPLVEHAQRAALYLDHAQIREMTAAGIIFGNHTATHPNLERLTETEQASEIESAQQALRQFLPEPPRAFSYPFGHHGSITASLARSIGMDVIVEVGGYNKPLRRQAIGRVHLAQESLAGLFARMEVVEPVKGWLRQRLRLRGPPASSTSHRGAGGRGKRYAAAKPARFGKRRQIPNNAASE
jgi:peptidoglycan/xylan/chitin deacetylase (PgdA/CDA1 family)